MKAILEFNLPEEDLDHRLALDGWKWKSACFAVDQWLRNLEKHGDKDTVEVAEVRKRLYEELNQRPPAPGLGSQVCAELNYLVLPI
ncbi:MAG: hypothetical protein KKH28_00085, partial [Elusimicrobia bacterium]|nr:hypothetical protein [Elusimicrobiota bacterium]